MRTNIHALSGFRLRDPSVRAIKARVSDRIIIIRWLNQGGWEGEIRNAYKILVGKPEGKWPLGGPRYRWESNIKIDLKK
jgi:hypothetical protein